MKITTKTTKEQLVKFIGANVASVKKQDKDLFDRIAYADKVMKTDDSKVTRKDLVDLAKEVIKLLGDSIVDPQEAKTPVEPQAENSVKKLSKGNKQKTKKENSSEEASEETSEESQEEPKKAEKKTANKSKKDDATKSSKEEVVQKNVFPDEFTVEDMTLEIAHDITSMDDLFNAIEKEENIYLAFYWTKAHLKKHPYSPGIVKAPKEFPHDLDLTSTLYVSDNRTVAYFLSEYTECCYSVIPEDFEEIDGVRYAGFIEYQIYRVV
jgi:hypothetical protein